jgi:hypothetical protein
MRMWPISTRLKKPEKDYLPILIRSTFDLRHDGWLRERRD